MFNRGFSTTNDEFGNRIQVFRDDDLDDNPDSVMLQTFECWADGIGAIE
ncbi:MAG: hypothetical protein GY822_06940 [Deltaproteobacteria bacterium]|nr:hypothetical protein [Deltaproteobacteria bacterium]